MGYNNIWLNIAIYFALIVPALPTFKRALVKGDSSEPFDAQESTQIILYCNVGFIFFIHAAWWYPLLADYNSTSLLSFEGSLRAVLIVVASTIFADFLVRNLKDAFNRLVIPAFTTVMAWFFCLTFIGSGIIKIVWVLIFTGTMSGFLLSSYIFHGLKQVIEVCGSLHDSAVKREVLNSVRDEVNGLLRLMLTSFLALGASVGVSMSILFRGGESAWKSGETQFGAARLVCGFGIVSLGILFFFVRPYMRSFEKMRFHYKLTKKDEIESWFGLHGNSIVQKMPEDALPKNRGGDDVYRKT